MNGEQLIKILDDQPKTIEAVKQVINEYEEKKDKATYEIVTGKLTLYVMTLKMVSGFIANYINCLQLPEELRESL